MPRPVPARDVPYYPSGRDYLCELDDAVIPDGAVVLATYDAKGTLVGVRAENIDGHTLHACGKPVAGHDMTPDERVEARSDESYAAETGS